MPDTNSSEEELQALLDGCARCNEESVGNVAMIVGDNGRLTQRQVDALLAYLKAQHARHVH